MQEIQEWHVLQLLGGGIEQAAGGRVGEADATVLIHHQDAFGGVVQHRGIERPGRFEILAQALQGPAIALVLEQRLTLGLRICGSKGLNR